MKSLAIFAGLAAPGLLVGLIVYAGIDTRPATEEQPAFALVSYVDRLGALYAETLDSNLTASDCAFALEAGYRMGRPASEVLLTCEVES